MSELTTREHILQVASNLFANTGYDNTSIRDISTKAEVNISAINYHFKSKAKLYSEVLNMNIINSREEINKIYERVDTVEEMAVEIFMYNMRKSDTFFNSMKLFLVNNLPLEKDIIPEACLDVPKGPPGTEPLMMKMKKELNYTGDEESLLWAARNIIHNIIIISLISQSSLIKIMKDSVCNFSEEEKIDSIRRNVRSTLNSIR